MDLAEAALGLCGHPGRYSESRTALPVERWPAICAMVAEGATYREIAAREGVSHEAMRTVVKRAQSMLTGMEIAR